MGSPKETYAPSTDHQHIYSMKTYEKLMALGVPKFKTNDCVIVVLVLRRNKHGPATNQYVDATQTGNIFFQQIQWSKIFRVQNSVCVCIEVVGFESSTGNKHYLCCEACPVPMFGTRNFDFQSNWNLDWFHYLLMFVISPRARGT